MKIETRLKKIKGFLYDALWRTCDECDSFVYETKRNIIFDISKAIDPKLKVLIDNYSEEFKKPYHEELCDALNEIIGRNSTKMESMVMDDIKLLIETERVKRRK